MPVIKHLDGVCHVYIDALADPEMAIRIADNAKTQRYSPCNTMETLLDPCRRSPRACCRRSPAIYADKGVDLRGCERSRAFADPGDESPATENDWYTEYLASDPFAVRMSSTIFDMAIAHIAKYGSQHTDAIVTSGTHANAMRFLREVDSSSVMVNASTRFADGFEYGLGAEIGISTSTSCTRAARSASKGLPAGNGSCSAAGQVREPR